MPQVKLKKSLENLDEHGLHIIDKDYLVEYGGTRNSIQFWKMVKTRVKEITHAKMTYKKSNYKFYLRTANEGIIEFSGFAGGYGGEGPTGCYNLMVDAGFDPEESKIVFEKEEFFLAKKM